MNKEYTYDDVLSIVNNNYTRWEKKNIGIKVMKAQRQKKLISKLFYVSVGVILTVSIQLLHKII